MTILSLSPQYPNSDDMLRKFGSKTFKLPFSLELVYLPFLFFRYSLEMTSLLGKKKKEEGLFLVDLVQGIPINIKRKTKFELEPGLEKEFEKFIDLGDIDSNNKDVIFIERKEVGENQVLPIILEEDVAIKRGKKLFLYDLMRITGSLRYRKVEISPSEEKKVLHYPYWLIYFRTKKKEIKFDVWDGLSGQKESGDIKHSIEIGLVRIEKNIRNLHLLEGERPN